MNFDDVKSADAALVESAHQIKHHRVRVRRSKRDAWAIEPKRLFVTGVAHAKSKLELQRLFEQFGTVTGSRSAL